MASYQSQEQEYLALEKVLADVRDEYLSAIKRFPPFNSGHEGYAVIKEELDELWEAIRVKGHTNQDRMNEARQVAAMAVRFMVDLA